MFSNLIVCNASNSLFTFTEKFDFAWQFTFFKTALIAVYIILSNVLFGIPLN